MRPPAEDRKPGPGGLELIVLSDENYDERCVAYAVKSLTGS